MSRRRTIDRAPYDGAEKVRHPETGRLVRPCRWCGTAVTSPRQSWCSDACVQEYLIRRSPSDARRAVERRDQGVCALCGLDTEAFGRWVWRLRRKITHPDGRRRPAATRRMCARRWRYASTTRLRRSEAARDRWRTVREDMARRGFTEGISLWQMDHVVPVVEGGGACGLDNLRTVCVPCHKRETAALAARRASGRKPPSAERDVTPTQQLRLL